MSQNFLVCETLRNPETLINIKGRVETQLIFPSFGSENVCLNETINELKNQLTATIILKPQHHLCCHVLSKNKELFSNAINIRTDKKYYTENFILSIRFTKQFFPIVI